MTIEELNVHLHTWANSNGYSVVNCNFGIDIKTTLPIEKPYIAGIFESHVHTLTWNERRCEGSLNGLLSFKLHLKKKTETKHIDDIDKSISEYFSHLN